MKCDQCSETATVHITDMSDGKRREMHLCALCAEKEKNKENELQETLEHIVKGIIASIVPDLVGEFGKLACPNCGTRFMEFRTKGRLGCATDYDIFQKGILPMLQRIHGSTEHKGKSPRRGSAIPGRNAELIRLRRELRDAVEREHYERAAELRDLIRAKEGVHESR